MPPLGSATVLVTITRNTNAYTVTVSFKAFKYLITPVNYDSGTQTVVRDPLLCREEIVTWPRNDHKKLFNKIFNIFQSLILLFLYNLCDNIEISLTFIQKFTNNITYSTS